MLMIIIIDNYKKTYLIYLNIVIFSNKVTRKKIIKELNLEPCGVTIQRESNVVKDEFYNDKTSQFYKLE